MSAKKRVYDIAKEIGMTGQELAAKLRDLGFTQIKSHMTALSDFEVLEIQARLEAYGIVGESSAQESSVGGLKLKRKRKASSEGVAEVAAEPPSPPPPPVEVAEAAPAPVAEPEAPVHEYAPPSEPESLAPVQHDVHATSPRRVPEPSVASEISPEQVQPTEPEPELEAVAIAPAEPVPTRGEIAEITVTPEAPASEGDGSIVRPSAKRRSGTVIGFIDPAQFQRQQPVRPDSRRLRSSDDVVPDVKPTMGRDRKAGVVRGDTTRGTMTAQELRDREQGRFLRRRRGQTG
ncbi:MAG: hypothetical protein HOP15_09730, partial [Planctomycetes bacterium]|nr:hypothetical protein [Planctomycetota bacterium]